MSILASLTDEEIVRRAHVELDPLTSTELEQELLRRLELSIGEAEGTAALLRACDDAGVTEAFEFEALKKVADKVDEFHDAVELLEVLADFDYEPGPLRKALERLEKFDRALQDLVEPLATLQTLATTE